MAAKASTGDFYKLCKLTLEDRSRRMGCDYPRERVALLYSTQLRRPQALCGVAATARGSTGPAPETTARL